MRKTACTDNEITLLYPKLTGFAKAAAAFAPFADRVSVYVRSAVKNRNRAFPKKRDVCSVHQASSHIAVKTPSQSKAFRHCLLRQGCCSVSKASPAFGGAGMI